MTEVDKQFFKIMSTKNYILEWGRGIATMFSRSRTTATAVKNAARCFLFAALCAATANVANAQTQVTWGGTQYVYGWSTLKITEIATGSYSPTSLSSGDTQPNFSDYWNVYSSDRTIGNVTLAGNAIIEVTSGNTVYDSGVISDGGNGYGIMKVGGGALVY